MRYSCGYRWWEQWTGRRRRRRHETDDHRRNGDDAGYGRGRTGGRPESGGHRCRSGQRCRRPSGHHHTGGVPRLSSPQVLRGRERGRGQDTGRVPGLPGPAVAQEQQGAVHDHDEHGREPMLVGRRPKVRGVRHVRAAQGDGRRCRRRGGSPATGGRRSAAAAGRRRRGVRVRRRLGGRWRSGEGATDAADATVAGDAADAAGPGDRRRRGRRSPDQRCREDPGQGPRYGHP